MGSQLQPQWDIGASTFSAAGALHSLMKAATVDDVQPMAVVAIEAIGSCLEVNPHVIGRAIDVLGESNSFRIENLKLTLGLSSGGIARQIRQSVPATRAFVLTAALLANHSVQDVADLLFEMLVHSGLHKRVASSRSQLRGLCNALQGHCHQQIQNEEQETEAWTLLLPHLAGLGNELLWTSILPEEGAKLLIEIFRSLREDDLDHILIRGANSGAWIAILLYQLLPGRVNFLVPQADIPSSEVADNGPNIVLDLDNDCTTWSIRNFYKVQRFSDILHIELDESSAWVDAGSYRELPSVSRPAATYSMLLASYCDMDSSFLDTVEVVSLTLVLIMLRLECEYEEKVCQVQHFVKPEFVHSLRSLLMNLGWPDKPENFKKASTSKFLNNSLSKVFPDGRGWSLFNEEWKRVHSEIVAELLENHSLDGIYLSYNGLPTHDMQLMIVRVTRYLLIHAISDIRCGTIPFALDLGIKPIVLDTLDVGIPSPSWIMEKIISMSIAASSSARLSQSSSRCTVALYNRGLVAFSACVQDVPQTPADACTIVILPGHLRFRDELCRYLCTDADSDEERPMEQIWSLDFETQTTDEGELIWRSSQATRFQINQESDGEGLLWLCSQTSAANPHRCYRSAIDLFVVSQRIDSFNGTQEEETRMGMNAVLEQIPYQNALWNFASKPSRLILTYSNEPFADFLRFSVPSPSRWKFFIQGRASMRHCILEAERLEPGGNWVIFSNPR